MKYSQKEIVNALISVGLKSGDNIFIHSNIAYFGQLAEALTREDYYKIFKAAIFEVIGDNGTLVMPAFSYSYCNNQVFDIENTESDMGMLAEFMRKDCESLRSDDANFSVVSIGPLAQHFTNNMPSHSFGEDSFWDRFIKKNGIICNFNFPYASTFIHYVERMLSVTYRKDKAFYGKTILGEGEGEVHNAFIHFVRDTNIIEDEADGTKFEREGRKSQIIRVAKLGSGEISRFDCKESFKFIQDNLKSDPYFLRVGV